MYLKILEQDKEHSLDKALGISPTRGRQLRRIIEEQIDIILENAGVDLLGRAYKAFAEKCNTLEEYTLCMHAFIFFISKIGALASDPEFRN